MYNKFIQDLYLFDFVRDEKKNLLLQKQRLISFEKLVILMYSGFVLTVTPNKNYREQYVIYITVDGYVWMIPCTIAGCTCRLITAYPSRLATKMFIS